MLFLLRRKIFCCFKKKDDEDDIFYLTYLEEIDYQSNQEKQWEGIVGNIIKEIHTAKHTIIDTISSSSERS